MVFESEDCTAEATFSSGEGREVGFFVVGKVPFPLSSQYRFTSGKDLTTFKTNSRLGLFLPVSRCDIVDLWTPILSAKTEAESP